MENHEEKPQALVAQSENPLDVAAELDDADDQSDASLADEQGRHDCWTGERMAMFCAILAETGIVTHACNGVGKSTTSAYSARRRNPLFAAAWEEALNLARNRLADALLERSLTGSVEKYYRDGELVGEKRILDNRLGMAILRRLDRKAETGLALHSNASTPVRPERSRRAPADTSENSPDWDLMLSALRTGDEDMMAEAMVEVRRMEGEGHKVGEVGEVANPPIRPPDAVNFDDENEPDPRCWWDEDEECWMTDFPPPPDFKGYQKGRWGDEDYKRECTPNESKILAAASDAELAEERSEDEAIRESYFAQLKSIAEPDPRPKKKSKKSASRPSA